MAEAKVLDKKLEGLIGEYTERKISKAERILGPELYRILKGIFTNPLSIIGFSLIVFFMLVAIFAPQIIPPKENTLDPFKIRRDGFASVPKPPGTIWGKKPPEVTWWYRTFVGDEWIHLFGTAPGGWDIFYGVIWGTRTAIKVGVIVEGITLIIGMIIGMIAGYYGGFIDTLIMRVVEIFQTFPFIMSAMTLSAILLPVLGKGLWPAVIALVVFGWMNYARLIRGDILSVRERDYVLAARVVGAKDSRIMFQHIVPNAIYPTLVIASLNVGTIVVAFAALSFLGIGTEIGYADWGQLISFARNWIPQLSTFYWILIYPGITLVLFVLGWNLVGDALRDIMDPRMRNR
jgi:peptide/nickel transport system permease protein